MIAEEANPSPSGLTPRNQRFCFCRVPLSVRFKSSYVRGSKNSCTPLGLQSLPRITSITSCPDVPIYRGGIAPAIPIRGNTRRTCGSHKKRGSTGSKASTEPSRYAYDDLHGWDYGLAYILRIGHQSRYANFKLHVAFDQRRGIQHMPQACPEPRH